MEQLQLKVAAIIQARMGSQRLPGKVLTEIMGKPMLQYLLERLVNGSGVESLIVATSDSAADDPLAEFCVERRVVCYRGSLDNVASRFLDIARTEALDAFIRISGDSPLLDQSIVREGLRRFVAGRYDLVTNVMPRSFPRGQSVEVVRAESFVRAYELMSGPEDFEHVTHYFYRNPNGFEIHNFAAAEYYGDIQMAVDTAEDLANISDIIATMDRPHWTYTLADLIRLYRALRNAKA